MLNENVAQNQSSKVAVPEMRELKPVDFWAGIIRFPADISISDAMTAIENAVKKLNIVVSGFITEHDGRQKFEMTRYPRQKFGPIPSVDEFESRLNALVQEMRSQGIDVSANTRPPNKTPQFRIVLGLEEGYLEREKRTLIDAIDSISLDNAKNQAQQLFANAQASAEAIETITAAEDSIQLKQILDSTSLALTHTIEEVLRVTGNSYQVERAEIFAAGSWGKYSEPAALLVGDPQFVNDAKILAESFRQARIAVELMSPQGGVAYMVEFPRWCKDPD